MKNAKKRVNSTNAISIIGLNTIRKILNKITFFDDLETLREKYLFSKLSLLELITLNLSRVVSTQKNINEIR